MVARRGSQVFGGHAFVPRVWCRTPRYFRLSDLLRLERGRMYRYFRLFRLFRFLPADARAVDHREGQPGHVLRKVG